VFLVFPCVPERRTPYLLSKALFPSVFASVLTSGKWEEWEEVRVRTPPLEGMLKNFKRGFNGDFGVKLTPGKLRTFCEIDWPAFGVE
jgi:hypothetical protein